MPHFILPLPITPWHRWLFHPRFFLKHILLIRYFSYLFNCLV
jgi:hypothetical protein